MVGCTHPYPAANPSGRPCAQRSSSKRQAVNVVATGCACLPAGEPMGLVIIAPQSPQSAEVADPQPSRATPASSCASPPPSSVQARGPSSHRASGTVKLSHRGAPRRPAPHRCCARSWARSHIRYHLRRGVRCRCALAPRRVPAKICPIPVHRGVRRGRSRESRVSRGAFGFVPGQVVTAANRSLMSSRPTAPPTELPCWPLVTPSSFRLRRLHALTTG